MSNVEICQRLRDFSINIERHENKLVMFSTYYISLLLLYKVIELSFDFSPYYSIALNVVFIYFYYRIHKRLNEKKEFEWWTGLPVTRYIIIFFVLLSLMVITPALFGCITYTFYKLNVIAFNLPIVSLGNVSDLFIWYGLDLVPSIAINETFMHPKPSLNSESLLFCWLLFLFKLTYIYLTIKLMVKWIKEFKE